MNIQWSMSAIGPGADLVRTAGSTNIAGVVIPSTAPMFLAGVGVHLVIGLVAVVCGAVAMLSPKRVGRHPSFGTVYFWSIAGLFITASLLAAARWAEDSVLFVLGACSFAFAVIGFQARRRRWPQWPRWHMTGMALSYIAMLTAFYVDNGKNLPVWRELPLWALWFGPSVIGLPILLYNLVHHPLVRRISGRRRSG